MHIIHKVVIKEATSHLNFLVLYLKFNFIGVQFSALNRMVPLKKSTCQHTYCIPIHSMPRVHTLFSSQYG